MLKTSHRISLYITIFVAILTALFFFILNTLFFVSWYRDEPRGLQADPLLEFVPQKKFERPKPGMKPGMQIMRRRQERTIRLSNISTGWQEQKRYFGIYNIREIEERRREIMPAPNGYVLIDVTQNINRQNWLGLYSAIMRVCILVLSFMLSGSVVRISLKDIITLSKSVKHSDISSLNEQHYFDNLPQDDEINTIAMAINTMKRRIQSQVSSLKEFLAFASHELKTPLMMIQSSAESAQFTKNYKASLANIKTGIEKMQHIIEQLNTFVKLDGNILLQRESANLTQLCKDIVKQLELIYGDKQISISIQSEQDLIINSYPHLINSILSNLLDNAFKYTNQNGHIEVVINKDGFRVSNTGETINEANLSRIREPFWQQDKTDGHGSGLGLAIVRKAVESLLRTIQASSKDNLTSFNINFDTNVKNS